MFKKVAITLFIISVGAIFFQLQRFQSDLQALHTLNSADADLISAKLSQDVLVGNLLNIFILAFFNVLAYKSRQPYWLLFPLVFFAFNQLVNACKGEALFRYKKAVGLWEGGFSVGPFFAIIVIAMAAVAILINYHMLRILLQRQASSNRSVK